MLKFPKEGGLPYKPFKMKGFPFHNPEHAETKKQTDRRLREEGYSEEEIDVAMRTGNIPDPGARDEQMMEDQGIEGGGMPMGYKPLKHYSVKKGSHKHPHKKGMPAKEGFIKTVKGGLHKKKKK